MGAAGLPSAPTARPKAPAEGPQALAEGLFSTLNSSAFPEIQQFNAREAGSAFSSHVPAFTAAQVINNNQPLLLAGSPIPLLSLFFFFNLCQRYCLEIFLDHLFLNYQPEERRRGGGREKKKKKKGKRKKLLRLIAYREEIQMSHESRKLED